MMGYTDLQLAKQQVSEQKQRVLRQQAVVLHLKGEGGKRLEVAVELWESMKDELTVMEHRLDRLIAAASRPLMKGGHAVMVQPVPTNISGRS